MSAVDKVASKARPFIARWRRHESLPALAARAADRAAATLDGSSASAAYPSHAPGTPAYQDHEPEIFAEEKTYKEGFKDAKEGKENKENEQQQLQFLSGSDARNVPHGLAKLPHKAMTVTASIQPEVLFSSPPVV
jgi:hypothetical protein